MSTETKVKYYGAKTTLSTTFDMTANYLKQVLKPVVEKGAEVKKDINQKIDTSDSQTMKDGREVVVATWDALGTALTGLGGALSKIGDEIGTNTK